MNTRDAVFVITEEIRCPLYNVGERLIIENSILTLPDAKPTCLLLTEKLLEIIRGENGGGYEHHSHRGIRKNRFECGGCTGIIRFEFKREKEFATLQMKLLAVDRQRRQADNWKKYYEKLRGVEVFKSLGDDRLWDLTTILQIRHYDSDATIMEQGEPATHLYILLSGRVAVIDDNGKVQTEMQEGEIFGEMSLLSGEPVTTTIKTVTPADLALLNSNKFKHTLNKYPVLQVFFYRLLINRIQRNNMARALTLSSGMTGSLLNILPVELFQLINTNQKTGRLELFFEDGKAFFSFNEGELVLAHYGELRGKEAFFAVLGKSDGNFTYTSGLSPREQELPVIAGFMILIMEGMKRQHETAITELAEKKQSASYQIGA